MTEQTEATSTAEELRKQLKQAYDEQGSLNDGEVLAISQQLDEVFLEMQRQKMRDL